MLQSLSYLTGLRLATGLLNSLPLDLPAMRYTHTHGYSELGIEQQMPGRILGVDDEPELSNSEMASLEW
jgi:hypothetical protein